MIRTLPFLKKNLNAVFNDFNCKKISPIYNVILNNYKGKDYRELEIYANNNQNKNIKLFVGDDWELYMQICRPLSIFHYYNNCILRHLNGNIMKSTVGDQVGSYIIKDETYSISKPTIIKNMDYSNSSYLLFKFKNINYYNLKKT
tara:strand:+ start:747 stop:1181 length:435 start_codon:yes stop_codon:yes gene_type:complete